MALGNFFTGTPATSQQFPTLSPQQQGLKSAVTQQALSQLQNVNSYGGFEPIAQRARQQFQTQTIPTLAERFTSLGGGQRSSAFQGALGQAGSDLESQLAALQSNYGLRQEQTRNQLLNMLLGFGFAPEVETGITPEQPGFLQSLGPAVGNLLPYLLPLLGGIFGGPAGATIGGGLGTGLSALSSQRSPVNTPSQISFPNQQPGLNLPNYGGLISNILGGQ